MHNKHSMEWRLNVQYMGVDIAGAQNTWAWNFNTTDNLEICLPQQYTLS